MSAHGPEFDPAMAAEEPLQPFDVMESSSRQGLMKLLVVAAILLALAFIVLKLYQPGVRDRGDPPLITAENTPFKVVPEDREGMQTPDQDKVIFETMAGRDTETDVVTLPTPEVPITVPRNAAPEDTPPATDTQEPVARQPVTPAPEPQQSTPSEPDVREPVIQRPLQTPPTRPAASDWVVQIASLRSQAEADRTYADVQTRHSNILGGYAADVRRVDLAEKGIYFRARASGFADKAEASSVCERLKAAGQACFVTKR